MARLSLNEKAARVLRMLTGLRDKEVGAAVAKFGFNESVIDEGWRLLRAYTETANGRSGARDETIARLDVWENEWFPAVQAMLERHHPAVAAQVFHNLAQTTGVGVALSVGTLIDRLDQMRTGAGAYGPEGVTAQAMLEARGFTDATTAPARELLAKLRKFEEGDDPPTAAALKDAENAEAAVWAWYLEWSRLARLAITSRRLLKKLGFLQTSSGESVDDAAPGGEETGDAAVSVILDTVKPAATTGGVLNGGAVVGSGS